MIRLVERFRLGSNAFVPACIGAMFFLPATGFAQSAVPPYPVKVVRVIVPFPPGEFTDYIKSETEKWRKVIKTLDAKVQ